MNDLPELVHNHEPGDDSPAFWNTHCRTCGGITCFADDSSVTRSNSEPEILNLEKEQYKEISDYMASNKLVLNSDKTHLLVMASEQNHKKHGNFGILLDTGRETIFPQDHEKLLGVNISSNFTWNEHLKNNEFSVHRQITSRINALKKISHSASFQDRKMIANGIVISRIIYAIQLWSGTSNYLIEMLQDSLESIIH